MTAFLHHRLRRNLIVSGGVLLVVCATAAALFAGGSSARPRAAVSPQILRHFALFRHHRANAVRPAATSGAPLGVRLRMARLGGAVRNQLQLDSKDIQEVTFGSTGSVWIEPGASGLCAVISVPADVARHSSAGAYSACSGSSNPVGQAVIAIGLEPDGSHMLYGAVPDGITNVVATVASGDSVTLPVSSNAVLGRLSALPQAVVLKDAAGNTITPPAG